MNPLFLIWGSVAWNSWRISMNKVKSRVRSKCDLTHKNHFCDHRPMKLRLSQLWRLFAYQGLAYFST